MSVDTLSVLNPAAPFVLAPALSPRSDVALQSQELSWTRGEVVTLEFDVVTGEDPTNFEMKFTMKPGYLQPEVLVKDTASGQITVSPEKKVWVAIPYADSKALGDVQPKEYLFDLWRTDTGIDVQMAKGKITIRPSVRTLP